MALSVRLFNPAHVAAYEAETLWRSIPTCFPTKSLYWPEKLNQDEQDLARVLSDLTGEVDSTLPQKDRWYQYGDLEKLEFCFDAVTIPVSRFSDGSFPVWYGGTSQETSKAEVTFHLLRQAEKELAFAVEETAIRFERALCQAHVRLGYCLDLTKDAHAISESGPPYHQCNKIALAARSKVEGILSPSRRWRKGRVVSVFTKDSIESSVVKAYWDVVIQKDGTTEICSAGVSFVDGWMEYINN